MKGDSPPPAPKMIEKWSKNTRLGFFNIFSKIFIYDPIIFIVLGLFSLHQYSEYNCGIPQPHPELSLISKPSTSSISVGNATVGYYYDFSPNHLASSTPKDVLLSHVSAAPNSWAFHVGHCERWKFISPPIFANCGAYIRIIPPNENYYYYLRVVVSRYPTE